MYVDVDQQMPVASVGKAFQILDLLSESSRPRSLKEIHEALNLPKTSTHSLLKTLVVCGVVRRTPSGLFMPGIKLYTMGARVRLAMEGKHLLLPRLQQLRDQFGHTVFFSLYDNGDLVIWEKADGLGSVLFKAYRGERKHLNTSSAGKAIAAYLPANELQSAMAKGLTRATDKSITSPEAFIHHMETVRQNGYAVDDEEGEPGVFCIGAPVFSPDHHVYGAVSMSILKSTMQPEDLRSFVQGIQAAARDISSLL